MIVHPKFKRGRVSDGFDIALVEIPLREAIDPSEIPMPTLAAADTWVHPSSPVWVLGWSLNDYGLMAPSLQISMLTITGRELCHNVGVNEELKEHMLCAYGGVANTCKGNHPKLSLILIQDVSKGQICDGNLYFS